MKSLVRGSIILSMVSLFVVFVYAQTQTEDASDIANDSQTQLNNQNNFSTDTVLTESENIEQVQNSNKAAAPKKEVVKKAATEPASQDIEEVQVQESNKAIKKTVSSKAIGGANRGSFTATAYCLKGRTASGTGVRRGIIAADPRVLPLGTRVDLAGGGQGGNYVVADTGGKIKGKKIDIWMASCADARRFGRRNVNISVLN
jgi:3D (Asp-Asp-Asp) domain-containing protein